MFSTNDYYDLNEAFKTIQEREFQLELLIRLEVMTRLLIQHDILNEHEITACRKYVETLPNIKAAEEKIDKSKSEINQYKANPQLHMKSLFNAKLNGQI